tara:strand:+ start:161 stop:502 length:342 start_codon:yes stop_codon:yes gene_type:complete
MKNNTSNASKLAITQGKGFRLSFDNGYSLSVQIGQYNYCDNYEALGNDSELLHNITNPLASTTFEAAIIDKDGELIVWPDGSGESYDTVGGYTPIADLPKWISYVSSLTSPSK